MSRLAHHISLHANDSPAEERANVVSHAIGVAAALLFLGWTIAVTPGGADRSARIVFAVTMIALFGASTGYHAAPAGSDMKRLFRLFDHLSIFLLIAGTYTPVMVAVGAPWARRTLAIVWALAASGMVLKGLLWDRFKRAQIAWFLGMGWLAVFHVREIVQTLPLPFAIWMITGGVAYSAGTIVYARKSMPFHHAIWHLFVLAGAASFAVAVGIYT